MAGHIPILRATIKTGTPAILLGIPGVGKTQTIYALVKGMGWQTFQVILSHREPSDVGGWMLPNQHRTAVVSLPIQTALDLNAAAERDGGAVLLIDEFTNSTSAHQAASLKLIDEKTWGDYRLHNSVSVILCANPPDWAADGHDISPPSANRMAHIPFEFDEQSFIESFPGYWGDPPPLGDRDDLGVVWTDTRIRLSGFFHKYPGHVLAPPKEESLRSGPWPSPRSWDKGSRLVAAGCEAGLTCCVGPVGFEALNYLREMDLPDPLDILANPKKAKIPKSSRHDLIFAVVQSVVAAAVRPGNLEKYAQAAWTYLVRVGEAHHPDLAAVGVRLLTTTIHEQMRAKSLVRYPDELSPPDNAVKLFREFLVDAGVLANAA